MALRRTTTLLICGLLAVGAAGCGFPPNGGGDFCIDAQEGDDPRDLGGTNFSTSSTRCIDPDNDEDVYDLDPTADGDLTVSCTTEVEDAVRAEIDPSTGQTVVLECGPGGPSALVDLDSTDTAQVTFFEGDAGVADEGESYQLSIDFDAD